MRNPSVGEGLDPPLGKRSLPLLFVIYADKMRFAKGGSRPSPTFALHNKLRLWLSALVSTTSETTTEHPVIPTKRSAWRDLRTESY